MGATWLGGVATFTTAKDWCTKIVLYPNATDAECVHLVLWFTKYASFDLCFHWDVFYHV